MDKASAKELLEFILESLRLIKSRFKNIRSSDDFLVGEEGLERLDSIAMRLQAIGEAVKNLEKRENEFLQKVADGRYWSEIIKTRDFILHQYVDLDAEAIFDICKNELQELEEKILRLQNLLSEQQ